MSALACQNNDWACGFLAVVSLAQTLPAFVSCRFEDMAPTIPLTHTTACPDWTFAAPDQVTGLGRAMNYLNVFVGNELGFNDAADLARMYEEEALSWAAVGQLR